MSRRLVAFGEAMLRLATPPTVPISVATHLTATVGGAELNAAIAARRCGMQATWVSTLPTGALGDVVSRHVAGNLVEAVVRRVDNARLGLYFLELAAPPRTSTVTYDRSDSAFDLFPEPTGEWHDLLDPDSVLLLTSITPALGAATRQAAEAAARAARDRGATVALDVNYRPTLWSASEAFAWVRKRLDFVDVLAASRFDHAQLGFTGDNAYENAVHTLGLRAIVGSRRILEGTTARVEVTAASPSGSHTASGVATVVDPIGAGDAMFGTFLATLENGPISDATERALGAVITSLGLYGDTLVADPWTPDQAGTVVR